MALKYRTMYRVRGGGRFPIDMLRYAQSFPVRETEANQIRHAEFDEKPYEVTLATHHETKNLHHLTPARWESFGWRIVPGSITTDRLT